VSAPVEDVVKLLWPYRDNPGGMADVAALHNWTQEEFVRALELLTAAQSFPALTNANRTPGRKKGSGADTLVCHLLDVARLRDHKEVLTVLKASTNPMIAQAVKYWGTGEVSDAYSRGKAPHTEACPYCKDSLPSELVIAIRRLPR
jgi:hypothetical protein